MDRPLNSTVEQKAARFRALPRELRLQALLGQARRFPELPPEFRNARDHGLGRVEECQTPLYLWIGVKQGRVRIHADVPREAPTVRGFVGFLIEVLDGAEPVVAAGIPEDLMERMGLSEVLGVQRSRGLGSVIRRIRQGVARVTDGDACSDGGTTREVG